MFHQDETQSAHWHKTQISVFAAAIWRCGECVPAMVVSDDPLLQSDAKILHVWSDGPSSQFKNRFIANCLPWFESKFNLKVY